jgi:uncharacterized protein (TIGR00297 family)
MDFAHLLLMRIIAGFSLALVISVLSVRLKILAPSGAAAAVMVGGCIFGFGGWPAAVALLVFFGSSTLLTKWRRHRKIDMGFEKGAKRDAGQVLANGGIAAVLAIAAEICPAWRPELTAAFLCALAEANADTWATEIGSASSAVPRIIVTMRPARPGSSGAVSMPGLIAALAGAMLIGATAMLFRAGSHPATDAAVAALGGFAGSLIDSILGATLQAQYRPCGSHTDGDGTSYLTERRSPGSTLVRGFRFVGNDTVNFLSTAVAAAIGFMLCHAR